MALVEDLEDGLRKSFEAIHDLIYSSMQWNDSARRILSDDDDDVQPDFIVEQK